MSLKITQLMLHKFRVDENVDHRKITVKTKCQLIHVTVLLRKFVLLHDQFLFMRTPIGGMDLRRRDRAAERPVRHMFRSRGFPRESRLK